MMTLPKGLAASTDNTAPFPATTAALSTTIADVAADDQKSANEAPAV